MAASQQAVSAIDRRVRSRDDDLLLRETNHRCSNDLQLIVSLLWLQSRRATNDETRQVLGDVAQRVAVVARARAVLNQDRQLSLDAALLQVCEALHAQAEPRGLLISTRFDQEVHGLSHSQITILALVVNELGTNAIKHAFNEGESGHVEITVRRSAAHDLIISVADNGHPLGINAHAHGSGLELVRRLMASIDGLFIPPGPGSKTYELRLPTLRDE